MATKHTKVETKYYLVFCGIIIAITFLFCLSYAIDNGPLITYEKELLSYINQYRIKNGLDQIYFDITLGETAEIHSKYMSKKNELSHASFGDRFKKSRRSLCVENIGWNYMKPEAQFRAWKKSIGHNKNMLNEQIKRAGISKVGSYVTFFACD
ncbi:MAG: hypothetical protein A2Z47_02330 [Thermodesulfovibrio sp. RBG_19FT_COMBO_42_12]|nr:MAG: hypothetical protein A2Z47_02330 [Thermodesulfovibrio sp. RBG_19FT_COMBO_42_12]